MKDAVLNSKVASNVLNRSAQHARLDIIDKNRGQASMESVCLAQVLKDVKKVHVS